MKCRISRSVLEEIRRDAAVAAPEEACGLLFGEGDEITGCARARNVADTRDTHFEIDPADLFAALRVERAGGAKLIGYWHSHPSGDPRPSATDAGSAAPDGKLWLIVAGDEVALWRSAGTGAVHGRFDAARFELMG